MLEKFFKFTPKSAAKWEKNRSKGRTHFVWFRGVLGWGLPMFVIMTAFNLRRAPSSLTLTLIVNAIIWPIGGYIWGAWMWAASEKAYKRYTEQKLTARI